MWLLNIIIVYLNNKFDIDIFITLLKNLFKTNINKNKILKILKSLYGLKQSKCIWNEIFKKTIKKAGFYFITLNLCIFKKEMDNNNICLIALYVDNIIIAFAKKSIYHKIKKIIISFFEVTNFKKLFKVLKIQINYNPKGKFIIID